MLHNRNDTVEMVRSHYESDENHARDRFRKENAVGALIVVIFSALICAPYWRSLFWLSDEGVLLHGAERMLQGERLYGDFFEFLPPGGFVLTATWFLMAGFSFLSVRLLAILTIVLIAVIVYLVSMDISRNARLSSFFVIWWVVISQGHWTIVHYHWFATLFSMVALWAVMKSVDRASHSAAWPFLAGLAAGASAMMVETCGTWAMLAASAAFLWPRGQRSLLGFYLLGCVTVPLMLLLYLASINSISDAFDDIILWTSMHYSSIQIVHFGAGVGPMTFPLALFFPTAAVLWTMAFRGRWRWLLQDKKILVCGAYAIAGFAGSFPRPDVDHIAFNVPLGLPIFTYCAVRVRKRFPIRSRMISGTAGVLAFLFVGVPVLMAEFQAVVALKAPVVTTPRGPVALVRPPGPDVLTGLGEIIQRIGQTPQDGRFYFFPSDSTLSFLSARKDISPVDYVVPYYTTPSQYRTVCRSVMESASWAVIDRRLSDPAFLHMIYPAMPLSQPNETKRFAAALTAGFDLVAVAGNFELRSRNAERANDTLCAGIAANAGSPRRTIRSERDE